MRRALLLIVVAASSSARAGMLVTEHFSMLDTWKAGGVVVDGVVVAVKGQNVDVTVKRVWGPASEPESKWAAGSKQALALTAQVKWTNEHESPLDTRLYGQVEAVHAGDELLFVQDTRRGDYRALPASAATLRAVAIIFDEAERAKYAAAPREVLEKDLGDDHLAAVALEALRPKGGPSSAALLAVRGDLLRAEYASMPASARKKFLAAAATITKSDRKARTSLARLAFDDEHVLAETIPELAAVAAALDAADDGERYVLADLYRVAARFAAADPVSIDLSPLASAVAAAFLVRGPSPHDSDEDLPRIAAHMSKAAQAQLANALQAGASTSREAKRTGGIDRDALAQAKRLSAPPDLSAFVEETFTLSPKESHAFKSGVVLNRLRDPPVLTAECSGGGGGALSFSTPTRYREWYACGYLLRIADISAQADATAGAPLSVRATPQALPPVALSFGDASTIGDKALIAAGCKASNSVDQDNEMGWMRATSSDNRCVALLGKLSHDVVRVEVR